MNQDIKRMPSQDYDDGIAPPPRFLLWAVVGIFIILVIAAMGSYLIIQGKISLSLLLALSVIAAPLVVVATIAGAIIFRKRLPRRFAVWLTMGWVVICIIGMIAFTLVFRNVLEPGQRETVKHYLPFMAIFAPPLPPINSSLPTPEAVESGVTTDDLLHSNFDLSAPTTATVEAPAVVVPATSTPALQSLVTAVITSTPLPTIQATATVPPTVAVTETSLPAPTQEAVAPASNQTVSRPSIPLTALLTGITPVKQGWNNC